MKVLQLLMAIFSLMISSLCFAEQKTASADVTPIKEIKMDQMDFEALSKESKIGNVLDLVKNTEPSSEKLANLAGVSLNLYPFAEELAYVNGVLCHIGNYSQSIIYTVLEGPYYGLQTITDYYGILIDVNPDYVLEYTPFGVILHHFYWDVEIITGSNQVIIPY